MKKSNIVVKKVLIHRNYKISAVAKIPHKTSTNGSKNKQVL